MTPTDTNPTPSPDSHEGDHTGKHVCPWWVGYLLASPLRRLRENPTKLLSPHVNPGMTVLDYGSAMGFFTIPSARFVGQEGRVIAVDLQERMLRTLRRRIARKRLDSIVETRVCTQEDPNLADLAGQVDVALVIHTLHETSSPDRVLAAIATALKPGGLLLLAEPRNHVSAADAEYIFSLPEAHGLVRHDDIELAKSYAALFIKNST